MEFPCHILELNLPDLDTATSVLTLVAALSAMEIQVYNCWSIVAMYKFPQ